MAVDEGLKRPRPGILEMLGNMPDVPVRETPPTAPEQPAALRQEPAGQENFNPDSRDYKAHGWSGNKTLPTLRFIRKNKSEFACHYHHLDSHPDGCEFIPSAPGKGNVIRLRFAGASVNFTVTIEGRNLRRCWELLMGHLTPWVYEYPADIDDLGKGEPVVKSITVTPEK